MKNKSIKLKPYHEEDLDFLKLQYQVLSDRQINHNSLLWNTPSLLFVAQAFLWDISLDDKINLIIRCCISLSSVLIGFASLQGFVRNRFLEIADSEQLYAIEKLISDRNSNEKNCPVMIIHHNIENCTIIKNGNILALNEALKKHASPLARKRTYHTWKFVFWAALFLAIILFAYNLYFGIKVYLGIDLIPQLLSALRLKL